MDSHEQLLEKLDHWFVEVRRKNAENMQCGRGCALCCHGLFDISLPDAVRLVEGMQKLPGSVFERVTAKAAALQGKILEKAPQLEAPYFLDHLTEDEIDAIVESLPGPACPFLGDENECVVYEHRPLACRLEGVPMVDVRDGLFGDWCELNFTEGIPGESRDELRLDYYQIEKIETGVTRSLSESLFGFQRDRRTLFIPSLIAMFRSYWQPLLEDAGACNVQREEIDDA